MACMVVISFSFFCSFLVPLGRFGKSKYINFTMHLDKYYVCIHSINYVSRFAKTTYNLEWREYNFRSSVHAGTSLFCNKLEN
jgi:hypothetical protein